MVNETSGRPRLTPKGARTRARIVQEAAALIHERGVAGTTLEDVKAAASSTIRARVRAPLGVSLGRSLVSSTMHQC